MINDCLGYKEKIWSEILRLKEASTKKANENFSDMKDRAGAKSQLYYLSERLQKASEQLSENSFSTQDLKACDEIGGDGFADLSHSPQLGSLDDCRKELKKMNEALNYKVTSEEAKQMRDQQRAEVAKSLSTINSITLGVMNEQAEKENAASKKLFEGMQ